MNYWTTTTMKILGVSALAVFLAVTTVLGRVLPRLPDEDSPGAVETPFHFESVSSTDLPKGVTLYSKPDETPETRATRFVSIAWIDLDGDGISELVVIADVGGTSGSYTDVYQWRRGAYKNIGWLGAGGLTKLLPRRNGYYQLEFWMRAGGSRGRATYRYTRGAYRCNRIDDFEYGKYVGTRWPKQ